MATRKRRRAKNSLANDETLFAIFVIAIVLIIVPWAWKAVIAFCALLIALIYIYMYRRKLAVLRRSGADQIDQMTGFEFEERLWLLFKDLGYTVEATPSRGDWGADLIICKGGDRIAVQAKRYSKPVGLSAVQEAVTAQAKYACTGSMVVTNNGFTAQARDLARHNGTILWDGDRLQQELRRTLS